MALPWEGAGSKKRVRTPARWPRVFNLPRSRVLDLATVHDQHPGRVDPSCLQLFGHGQAGRRDEQDPAAVALAQASQGIQQRRLLQVYARPVIMPHLALMAGGPGGDHTGRGGERAMTQGLAHMSFLYE